MTPQLTQIQERFASEYALNGGNATRAALSAGYSEKSAGDLGRRALALPHVQAAVLRELLRLRCRSGAIGLDSMVRIATDEKAPAAARVSAARALMEHAGMLGTAKEITEARENVERDGGKVVNYVAVLEALRDLPKANNDDAKAQAAGAA